METKACKTCASAKRRCGNQLPQCLRCRTRGVKCIYPPSKPSQFIILPPSDEEISIESALIPDTTLIPHQYPTTPPEIYPLTTPSSTTVSLQSQSQERDLLEEDPTPWFSTPSTWKVLYPAPQPFPAIPLPDLKAFITTIHAWLRTWLQNSSNPFIHARLYRGRLPTCMQDAYASLACYYGRGEGNEGIVNGVLEGRVLVLVGEYVLGGGGEREDGMEMGTLQHVARVQALLIYQVIGLYDGDIRLRYLAEKHIPILSSWLEEMVTHASHTSTNPTYLDNSLAKEVGMEMAREIPDSEKLWYDWILTETIRRTWIVASGIQAVFKMAQEGGAVTCQGGMMFTTRKGAWEAESAVKWERLCCEVHVGLMQMAEAERLFNEGRKEDVNEFTMVVLRLVFGEERMDRWGEGEG